MRTIKPTSKKQLGFTPISLLILLAILMLLGIVGWRTWDSRQTPNKDTTTTTQNTQSQQNTTSNPNEGYIVIKEWNVRFKPVEGLEGVEYFRPNKVKGVDAISFTTKRLAELEPQCGPTSETMILGLLNKSKEVLPEYGGVKTIINGYNFQYRGPQAACSKNPANYTQESQDIIKLSESLDSLELAE